MDEATALKASRQQLRRGAYGPAIQALAALPPTLMQAPRVAFARTRAHLLQGRIADAEIALTNADRQRATAGERLILSLEDAWPPPMPPWRRPAPSLWIRWIAPRRIACIVDCC
jgi:hypothetical protein